MWIHMTTGFYSVVLDPSDSEVVMVRARVRADLERLDRYSDMLTSISPSPERDYPFRVFTTKAEWAKLVARAALDIGYRNFKDAVRGELGSAREAVCTEVWTTLRSLNRLP